MDHRILLEKLKHCGVRGVANDILHSYLSQRTQYIDIKGTESKPTLIKHGVPQGSVLGPLLFSIYINDLHKSIEHSTAIHFADDTTLLCQDKSLKEINRKVNRDLALLVHWLRANKISLNASKTEIILFRTKYKTFSKNLNFRLSGQKIEPSDYTKYLGVLIDKHLSWDHQLNSLNLKLSRSVGILAKLRHYLNYKTLLAVYHATFDSHINYCIQTLGFITSESFERLEILQRKALRLMHFKGPREHTLPLFVNSRILPVRQKLKLKNCLFAFDHMKGNLPKYFSNFLRSVKHNHGTRRAGNFMEIQQTKTVRYGSYNISNSIARDWNLYHSNILNFKDISKSTFKKHLHSFILTGMAAS